MPMPIIDPVLDGAERGLVDRTMAWLRDKRPEDSGLLWAQLKRVAMLGAALEEAPSLLLPSGLGRHEWNEKTLTDHLSHLDTLGGELRLPEKAVVARAFLMAKISLLRGFMVALEPGAPAEEPGLMREFKGELAQSIFTAIAGEILISLLSDPELAEPTKVRAARQLILIWDGAVKVEIDDFCPLLESAWRARSRLPARFGALAGCGEYMRLMEQDCPPQFLDFFTRDNVTDGEMQAFEEFLFNLTHEDLQRVRVAMKQEDRRVIDSEFVARALDRPMAEVAAFDDPDEIFRSYRRRRTAAEFRHITHAPGPLRVAEAYIMIFVLESAAAAGAS